jgi:hypothetical protein
LLELLDRVESVCESIDAEWCDGVADCGVKELERIGSLLVSASHVKDGLPAEETMANVSELLECLEECGSIVGKVVCGLRSARLGPGSGDMPLRALAVLRKLPPDRQAIVSDKEMVASKLVMGCLVPESGAEVGCQLRESGCIALFVLACRNGLSVCGNIDFLDAVTCNMIPAGVQSLLQSLSPSADNVVLEEMAAASAAVLCGNHLALDAVHKLPAALRGPMEKKLFSYFKENLSGLSKGYNEKQIRRCWSLMMQHRLLDGDLSLACGLPALVVAYLTYAHLRLLPTAIEAGVFSATMDLYERIEVASLGGEWWLETSTVVDVQSVYAFGLNTVFARVKFLSSTLIESLVLPSSWWRPVLTESIRMVKINATAGLSARENMPGLLFAQHTQIVETSAKHGSQHQLLLEPGFLASLEFAATHDFMSPAVAIAAAAAGTLISLLGRNEGGKTLDRPIVAAVLSELRVRRTQP